MATAIQGQHGSTNRDFVRAYLSDGSTLTQAGQALADWLAEVAKKPELAQHPRFAHYVANVFTRQVFTPAAYLEAFSNYATDLWDIYQRYLNAERTAETPAQPAESLKPSKAANPSKKIAAVANGRLTESGKALIDALELCYRSGNLFQSTATVAYVLMVEERHWLTPVQFLEQNPGLWYELAAVAQKSMGRIREGINAQKQQATPAQNSTPPLTESVQPVADGQLVDLDGKPLNAAPKPTPADASLPESVVERQRASVKAEAMAETVGSDGIPMDQILAVRARILAEYAEELKAERLAKQRQSA